MCCISVVLFLAAITLIPPAVTKYIIYFEIGLRNLPIVDPNGGIPDPYAGVMYCHTPSRCDPPKYSSKETDYTDVDFPEKWSYVLETPDVGQTIHISVYDKIKPNKDILIGHTSVYLRRFIKNFRDLGCQVTLLPLKEGGDPYGGLIRIVAWVRGDGPSVLPDSTYCVEDG